MTPHAPDVRQPPTDEAIKVWFRFVARPGWLPYDTEALWAVPVGPGTARLCNVPFLQNGAARGDVVRYETDADGRRWALSREEPSGHCVIRVLPSRTGPLGPDPAAVRTEFAAYRLEGEVFSDDLPLVAFDVPPDADFAGIKSLLLAGRSDGRWQFEEGSTTERWRAA